MVDVNQTEVFHMVDVDRTELGKPQFGGKPQSPFSEVCVCVYMHQNSSNENVKMINSRGGGATYTKVLL